MKNRDTLLIKKILHYCSQIEEAMGMFHNDLKVFKSNSVFQNACCMCVLQIGELAKLLSDECKQKYKDIPWKEWCGIRDVFAHQYSSLDIESAWLTLTKDVPTLKARCIKIYSILLKNN